MIYPVITLYQPWATWIIRGWKTIETRTHDKFSCLNGKTILIHAGKNVDMSDLTIQNPYLTTEQILYKPDEMVGGYILGRASVKGYRKLNENDSKDSLIDCGIVERYGLLLHQIERFHTPIKATGSMGIWYFDTETMQKVKKPK